MERELPELLTGRRGHACGGFVFEDRNVRFMVGVVLDVRFTRFMVLK